PAAWALSRLNRYFARPSDTAGVELDIIACPSSPSDIAANCRKFVPFAYTDEQSFVLWLKQVCPKPFLEAVAHAAAVVASHVPLSHVVSGIEYLPSAVSIA